jgi:hypothetical protein
MPRSSPVWSEPRLHYHAPCLQQTKNQAHGIDKTASSSFCTSRSTIACIVRVLVAFCRLGLQLLVGLLSLRQKLFDLLLERVKVAFQGGGSALAALELFHRLQCLSEPGVEHVMATGVPQRSRLLGVPRL